MIEISVRRSTGFALVAGGMLLLAACGGGGESGTATTTPPAGAAFKGSVTDQNTGQPISGAVVSLDGIEAIAPTDGSGAYELEHPGDSGCHTLTVNAPGFAPFASQVRMSGDQLVSCGAASRKLLGGVLGGGDGGIILNPLPNPATLLAGTPLRDTSWLMPAQCDGDALSLIHI